MAELRGAVTATLRLARAASYALRITPCQLGTLDEVRAGLEEARSRMARPPSEPVEWVGTCRDDGREARTYAQLWKSAVDICAAMLGVTADRVDCIRADEQRLSGTGAA